LVLPLPVFLTHVTPALQEKSVLPGTICDLMSSSPEGDRSLREIPQIGERPTQMEEKVFPAEEQVEVVKPSEVNLTYDEVNEEPSLHVRTYIALAAMFMLNLVQLVALQGPPTFVCLGSTSPRGRRFSLTRLS
jgi:hypothetical protein